MKFDVFTPQQLRDAIEFELQYCDDIKQATYAAMKKLKENSQYYAMQKARIVKYIRRVPKPSGKGYYYFYNKADYDRYKKTGTLPDEKKKGGVLDGILAFFGLKSKEEATQKAKDMYADHKSELAGVDFPTFADYLNEYLTNKATWDKRFSAKPETKGDKTPEKKKDAKKDTPKKAHESNGKKYNLSVMKKIAGWVSGAKTEKTSGRTQGATVIEHKKETAIEVNRKESLSEKVDGISSPTLKFLNKNTVSAMKNKEAGGEVVFEQLKREIPNVNKYLESYKSMNKQAKERYKNIYDENVMAKNIYDKVKNNFETTLNKKDGGNSGGTITASHFAAAIKKTDGNASEIFKKTYMSDYGCEFSEAFKKKGMWTNGRIVVLDKTFSEKIYSKMMKKGSLRDSERTERMSEQISKIRPTQNLIDESPAKVIGTRMGDDGTDKKNIIFMQGEKATVVFDANLVAFFHKEYGDKMTIYSSGSQSPAIVQSEGKEVGLLMPILPKDKSMEKFEAEESSTQKTDTAKQTNTAPKKDALESMPSVQKYLKMMREQLDYSIDQAKSRGASQSEIDGYIAREKASALGYVEKLKSKIDGKNYDELTSVLHTGNKSSRAMFEEFTGVKLGSTDTSMREAVKKYVGEDKMKEHAEKEKKADDERAQREQDKKDKEKKDKSDKEETRLGKTNTDAKLYVDTDKIKKLPAHTKERVMQQLEKIWRIDGKSGSLRKMLESGEFTSVGQRERYGRPVYVAYTESGSFIDIPKVVYDVMVSNPNNPKEEPKKEEPKKSDGSAQKQYDDAKKTISEYERDNVKSDYTADEWDELVRSSDDDETLEYYKAKDNLPKLRDAAIEESGQSKMFKARLALEETLAKAVGEKSGHKYVKRIERPGGARNGRKYVYFYTNKQVEQFKKDGTIPAQKGAGDDKKPTKDKKALDDNSKQTIKTTLKKVANILSEALRAKDPVNPTGHAVEEGGESMSRKKKAQQQKKPDKKPDEKEPIKKEPTKGK